MKFGLVLPEGGEFRIALASFEGIVKDAMKLGGNIASSGVKNKGNRAGVMWGVTKENSDAGAVGPFVVGVPSLKVVVEDIDGGPKRMKMCKVGFDGTAAKARNGRVDVLGSCEDATAAFYRRDEFGGKSVAEIDVVFESRRP